MANKNPKQRRYDIGELRQASRTPQGFLKIPGFATRTGVFPYLDANGKTRRELRHPDDVFDPASMETLKYAPVTIEHPPEMLNPENVSQYSVGHTTERVEKIEEKLDTDLIVEDQAGIDAIEKDGIRELSCGYEADIVEEDGVYNGAPYDYRQINIRYNHLAMVKRGRAGPEIRLRLDSKDAVMQPDEISKPGRAEFSQESGANSDGDDESQANIVGEPKSKKLVVSGREIELPSDVADTIQDLIDRYDEMGSKLSILEENVKTKRSDNKDVDITQKGVSPQVKVEQQSPDGRSAGGKDAAAGKVAPGSSKPHPDAEEEMDEDARGVVGGEHSNSRKEGGKELADDDEQEEKHGDDEEEKEEKKEDYEAGAGSGAGGAALSPVDQLKKDLDEARKKVDSLQGKLDAYAAESMGKDEKRGDSKDFSQRVRARVILERQAEKLVPFEVAKKFDSMSDDQIRKAVIKHHSPKAELDGKSTVYLQSRFDHLCESLEDEDGSTSLRAEAGRRMLGIRTDSDEREDGAEEVDPNQARLKMIQSSRDFYKSDLSARKK